MLQKFLGNIVPTFIPLSVDLITLTLPSIWPNYFIVWSGDAVLDNSLNSLKAKAVAFINSILQSFKEKINNEELINSLIPLVTKSIENLEFVVNNRFEYLQNMNKESSEFPDYNYENLIYQIMLFLGRFLSRDPLINYFSPYIKK